ncbi:hypothetical protein CERZMDRAFT_82571 [Cercospora zeae-maydis SCOH1-5]|uniref:Uncharacterized protein n=1 Tax=Cercospora zeae-maydis SCOH1-5 TaxID=717836 RepID=A0A6A6FMM1_9PEZI|nr:hypothetical protein CERZMDRAFT_82571 [Cercospora zeae-maydis SCOH1-5]
MYISSSSSSSSSLVGWARLTCAPPSVAAGTAINTRHILSLLRREIGDCCEPETRATDGERRRYGRWLLASQARPGAAAEQQQNTVATEQNRTAKTKWLVRGWIVARAPRAIHSASSSAASSSSSSSSSLQDC